MAVLYRWLQQRGDRNKKRNRSVKYIYRIERVCGALLLRSAFHHVLHITLFARLVFLSRLSQEFCIRRDKYHNTRHVSLSYTYIYVGQTWMVPLSAFRLFYPWIKDSMGITEWLLAHWLMGDGHGTRHVWCRHSIWWSKRALTADDATLSLINIICPSRVYSLKSSGGPRFSKGVNSASIDSIKYPRLLKSNQYSNGQLFNITKTFARIAIYNTSAPLFRLDDDPTFWSSPTWRWNLHIKLPNGALSPL
jgi:hypothetical protein